MVFVSCILHDVLKLSIRKALRPAGYHETGLCLACGNESMCACAETRSEPWKCTPGRWRLFPFGGCSLCAAAWFSVG